MSYLHWLVGITLGFFLLERLFPPRPRQPQLRSGLLRDLGFLAVNGHVFSMLTAGVIVIGIVYMLATLVADLIIAWMNPRARLETGR